MTLDFTSEMTSNHICMRPYQQCRWSSVRQGVEWLKPFLLTPPSALATVMASSNSMRSQAIWFLTLVQRTPGLTGHYLFKMIRNLKVDRIFQGSSWRVYTLSESLSPYSVTGPYTSLLEDLRICIPLCFPPPRTFFHKNIPLLTVPTPLIFSTITPWQLLSKHLGKL